MRYIGIDIHKDKCVGAIVDDSGKVVDRVVFRNEIEEWERIIKQYCNEEVSIAMEATTYAMKPYQMLRDSGIDVHLANTYKLRLIAQSRSKTDFNDSVILAQLLRTKYLPDAFIPPEDIREIRDLLRLRNDLQKEIIRIKNKVHAVLDAELIKLKGEYTDIFGKKGREELRNIEARVSVKAKINTLLNLLDSLEKEKKDIEGVLKYFGLSDARVKLLMTIPGVGDLTAMSVVYEVGDFDRFENSRKLCAYAGLVPSVRASGDKEIHGHTRNDCNHHLKHILTEAALCVIRYDGPFKKYYQRISRKRGSKVAIVATARKLLTVMYAMIKNNERYWYEDEDLTLRKIQRMEKGTKDIFPTPPHTTAACAEPSPSARRPDIKVEISKISMKSMTGV